MSRKIVRGKHSSINNFIRKVLAYWPLFLILFVISVTGAWIYSKLATPVYEVKARILIKEETKDTENAKAIDSLDLISPKTTIDNEIEVIQSKRLLISIVRDLNLNAPIFEKRKFASISAYTSSPIKILTDSLTFKETKQVFFKVKNDNVVIDGNVYPLNKWVNTPYGKLQFEKNTYAVEPQNEKQLYFSLISSKKMVTSLANNLKITTANKMSGIVNIHFIDEVPIRGKLIIDNLVKVYNQARIAEKKISVDNTSAFINEHLQKVESDLLLIEKKLQTYKSGSGAVDVGAQGKIYLQNVSANDQQVNVINMKLFVLNQVANNMNAKDFTNEIVPSNLGIDDPVLIQMLKNIYELKKELKSIKTTFGEDNALYLSCTDRINKIKSQFLGHLQKQKASLQASLQDISSANNNYASALQSMPSTQRELVDIDRQQNIESGLYTFLLQKKEDIDLFSVSNLFVSKIIDAPRAVESPTSPMEKFDYLRSLAVALIFCIGIVGGKELLQSKVMFQKDIEGLTILPVIGEITAEKSKNPIVIYDDQRTLIAGQFRKLRTSLTHFGIGSGQKRIMITSSMSGEGKSFVAVNLAISLALTGKKVVLVDYDLNNPSFAKKLNVESGHLGVTEYLQGSENAESIVIQTEINENLFFIPAGKLPINPSELIANGKSEGLLKQLDTMFDYVIIDMAPVGPVSDAYVLSPFCDAILYIVRHGYTPKNFVERIDENNKLTNAAIVFNCV